MKVFLLCLYFFGACLVVLYIGVTPRCVVTDPRSGSATLPFVEQRNVFGCPSLHKLQYNQPIFYTSPHFVTPHEKSLALQMPHKKILDHCLQKTWRKICQRYGGDVGVCKTTGAGDCLREEGGGEEGKAALLRAAWPSAGAQVIAGAVHDHQLELR